VPEVEPYLSQAEVVAAPIRVGGGMRTKVLQGMALAKPVVTTPLGAEGLASVGADPPLAIARDAETFAATIDLLLAEPRRRRKLGNSARWFVVEHFSPAAYARRLERVYAELLPTGAAA
jgi:glycosyltransferase involved in cell wall biosynthesis